MSVFAAMDIPALYSQKRYYEVILGREHCEATIDHLCLGLSLASIGRVDQAVLLLLIMAEETMDPKERRTILDKLHALTEKPEFLEEKEYWEGVDCSDSTCLLPSLQPSNLSSYEQVRAFQRNKAFIHPSSYAAACFTDHDLALKFGKSSSEVLMLEVVGRFAPNSEVRSALKSRAGQNLKSKLEKETSELPEDCEEMLRHLQNWGELVAIRYLEGYILVDDCHTLIESILNFRDTFGKTGQRVVLDFDIQTICIIASEAVSVTTPSEVIDELLSQLVGDFTMRCESQLRKSAFFDACGNLFRVLAQKAAVEVAVSGSKALLYERSSTLEAARKYAIAAANHPQDDPFYYKCYEKIIWCLLLAGGVDVRVIWLFSVARNYFKKELYFAFAEPTDLGGTSWPHYDNQFELLDKLFDACNPDESFGVILLPTVLEEETLVLVATQYVPRVCTFVHRGGYLVEPSRLYALLEEEMTEHLASSDEILDLWLAAYGDVYGQVPKIIAHVLRSQMLRDEDTWDRE